MPDEGLEAPTQAPARTKLSHRWFGDATSGPGGAAPQQCDSTGTKHLLDCLCGCSPPGLPLWLLLAGQLWLLPKLGWKLQWFWTMWCAWEQHFGEVGVASGVISPVHFSDVSRVGP